MKKERTPEEKMAAFIDLVAGDEKKPAEAAPAQPSDADLDRQLSEAGFDLGQVNAHIDADRQAALRALAEAETAPRVEASPPAKVIALPRRRSTLLWLMPLAAAFAGLFALGGAAVVAWLDSPDNTTVASGGNAEERARGFRDDAYAACQHERYAECLEKIDYAIQLYPPFAKDADLAKLRAHAKEKMSAADREGGGG